MKSNRLEDFMMEMRYGKDWRGKKRLNAAKMAHRRQQEATARAQSELSAIGQGRGNMPRRNEMLGQVE